MTIATIRLFTSLTCPHCPPAREIANQFVKAHDDVQLNVIVSGESGSEKQFAKFDVRSVPTFIITGPGYAQNIGLRGVQDERSLRKYCDIALGVRDVEEQKGFWAGLFWPLILLPNKENI